MRTLDRSRFHGVRSIYSAMICLWRSASYDEALWTLAAVVLLLGPPRFASAQGSINDAEWRFTVSVGGLVFNSFDSRLRVDAPDRGRGTELNLEDDLDLEENLEVGRIDATFRFGKRGSIAASYYDIRRSGLGVIEKDIHFKDELIPIRTLVVTDLNQRIYKAAYRRRFIDRPRVVLSASFGLHVLSLDTSILDYGGTVDASADATAPLPVLGAHVAYLIKPKWRMIAGVELFDVEVGDVSGQFRDGILSLERELSERIHLGFGFNRSELDVRLLASGLRGTVFLNHDASFLYLKTSFGRRGGGKEP